MGDVKMPIMEIFGPTIQGEGMVIGRKTMFVRTGGCDYSCSWCDSAFTWNGTQKATMMTAEEVFDQLVKLGEVPGSNNWNFRHVTITGGNPALIGLPMMKLLHILHNNCLEVGLETQGTKWQEWFRHVDDLTISPKPPSSGMTTDFEKLAEILNKAWHYELNVSLKVVIFDEGDLAFAKYIHKEYPLIPFFLSVGNRDSKEEGDISSRLLQKLHWLWDKVLADPDFNDVKPLPQLHTLVWANKRGV